MLTGRLPGSRRKPSLDEYLGPGRVSLSFLGSTFPDGWPAVQLWLEALFNITYSCVSSN